MWRLWTKLCMLSAFVIVTHAEEFGLGMWDIKDIKKCEEEDHKFKYDLELVKINETQIAFKGHILAEIPFTETCGIRIELFKFEEDEWKKSQMFYDDCFYDFFNKYAPESVSAFFIAAGIENAELPIKEGDYEIKECLINLKPALGVEGLFSVKLFVVEEDTDYGCVEIHAGFTPFDKDE